MAEVHKEIEALTPEQRQQIWESMGETFRRREDARMAAYFALPPKDRTAYLDKTIKEMEQRRKEMTAFRSQAGQSGQSRPSGSAGGGPRPPRQSTFDARIQHRNERLDRSTPEQRAQRYAFVAALNQRRSELGLPQLHRGPPR
jgi:hypothetical protein